MFFPGLKSSAVRRIACALGIAVMTAVIPASQSYGQSTSPQTAVRYRVFVHSLHVMDIQASYRLSDQQYGIAAHVKTTPLFGLFMKTDLSMQAQGRFEGQEVDPDHFETEGWSRRQQRHARIVYKDQTPEVTLLDPPETDREPVTQEERKGAMDVLAMLMGLLHQVRLTQSCQGQEKIFDGLRLTTLSIQSVGEQKLPSGGPLDWGEAGLRCNFVGQQIKGFKFTSDKSKLHNPQPGRVWFEKIGAAGLVAVRIELDHPKLGRISVLLDGAPNQYP